MGRNYPCEQTCIPFESFQSLQRTYSWMKYYNSELDSRNDNRLDEKVLRDLLEDVRKSIIRSLTKSNETGEISNSTEHRQIEKETIEVTSNNIRERIIDRAKQEFEVEESRYSNFLLLGSRHPP